MTELINKIDLMLDQARAMINTEYDKGFDLLNEAMDLSEKNRYMKGVAWATLGKGAYLFRKDDKSLAISFFYKALRLMEENQDKKGQSRTHYSIATSFAVLTQYDQALSHFLKALQDAEDYDQAYYSKILNNLSNVYRSLGKYQEAIQIGQRALEYMVEHEEERTFMPYTSLGHAYLDQGDYKEALAYADKALMGLETLDEGSYRSAANMIAAGAYKGLQHYDEALIVYNRGLAILEGVSDQHHLPYIHREISELYLIKKEYNYAFKHIQTAMTEAIKQHNELEEAEILIVYAKLYESLEDYKKAYDAYKRGKQILENHQLEVLHERYEAFMLDHADMFLPKSEEPKNQVSSASLSHALKELESGYSFMRKVEKGVLTDAFVEAVVETIDYRDTTTSGHSKRLAEYATETMKKINEDMEDFPEIYFTDQEIKTMYYAALLHDIGKLGVPEKILLKKQRLSEEALQHIRSHLAYIGLILAHKKELMPEEVLILENLDDLMDLIIRVNKSPFLSDTDKDLIREHLREKIEYEGAFLYLIPLDYHDLLMSYRGNLSQVEWEVMKSHAMSTIKFLNKIPWMEDLDGVPKLAGSHHEKLDGTGYPHGLKGEDISIASRILCIVDIFEALTAKDRPYKEAYTVEDALTILRQEARMGKIDGDLVDFFIKHDLCHLFIKKR